MDGEDKMLLLPNLEELKKYMHLYFIIIIVDVILISVAMDILDV